MAVKREDLQRVANTYLVKDATQILRYPVPATGADATQTPATEAGPIDKPTAPAAPADK
jgi:hypothetical protein